AGRRRRVAVVVTTVVAVSVSAALWWTTDTRQKTVPPADGSQISRAPSKTGTAPGSLPTPTDLWWVRVSGPGCGPNNSDRQLRIGPGWKPTGDGWRGDGCDGSTLTAVLTDDTDSGDRSVLWFFTPKRPVNCQLEAYIPDTANAAGTATYEVLGKGPGAALIN